MRVPLAVVGLDQADIQKVVEILESGNLTMGAEVRTFESLLANYLGVDHFVMVNSGSSANLLMFEYLLRPSNGKPSLQAGDGVLVPAIAWPTTIWPLIQLGLVPIFVDVNRETFDLNLESARKAISLSKAPVKAIFPIHPLGYAIQPSKLRSFANEFSLVLVNDVCESLGSWSEGLHAGVEGLAASFSFYFSHHITTMEGGGIATNENEYADDLRSMRSHGWSRDRSDAIDWNKKALNNNEKFLFISTGFNFRPMEIQAVVGSSQILQIDEFVNRRRQIAKRVNDSLLGTELSVIGSESLVDNKFERINSWMLIPIYVSGVNSVHKKKLIIEELNEKEIETRPVLTGNFLAQPAIQRITRYAADYKSFVVAQDITENAFLVGAHHDLSEDQIIFLCKTLKSIANKV
jgi:CDP-6-deoxy-D-xylo-4-hexulose-3-dehydrase